MKHLRQIILTENNVEAIKKQLVKNPINFDHETLWSKLPNYLMYKGLTK